MPPKDEQFDQKILHVHTNVSNEPQLKIELTRGQRGGYGWTITYAHQDFEKVFETIKKADERLRKEFLGEESD